MQSRSRGLIIGETETVAQLHWLPINSALSLRSGSAMSPTDETASDSRHWTKIIIIMMMMINNNTALSETQSALQLKEKHTMRKYP